MLKPSDIQALENNNLKILILGYKHLRRGDDFYDIDHENIEIRQSWLYENLSNIIEKFNVVSFDNLAIEQLNARRLMTDEEWYNDLLYRHGRTKICKEFNGCV